jgi:hypothetical protein
MTPQQPQALCGWYSQEAAERFGSCFYSTPDGDEVEVTCVFATSDTADYRWSDKVNVGPVVAWLREGRPDPNPMPDIPPYDYWESTGDWR